MEIGKKKVFALRNLVYCPLMSASLYSSSSNNCEIRISVAQFDQNLGQELIVLVFREIRDFY